jgi:GNAT superfamily N-acetyltransferase
MEFSAPTQGELAFIFDSWSNSYRKSPFAGCTPNHLYDQVSRECMRTIMDRGALVICAVTPIADKEDEYPSVRRVMAYSVSEPDRKVLHWLYVKKDYRGVGVGRELLTATVPTAEMNTWIYTHKMRASTKFLRGMHHDDTSARVK